MKTDPAGKIPKRTSWLIALASLFLLYTVLGFFVVPALVKSQLLTRLPILTKRRAALERVRFNPFVLSLTLEGLSLKETNGDVFSSFGELYVNFQLSSIFKRSFVFDEISLRDPYLQITYLTNGAFNFSDLIPNAPPSPAPVKSRPPPRLMVRHFIVTNGAVAFADLSRPSPFQVRFQPINVRFTDFTTLPGQSSQYEISAAGDSGENFSWAGNITVNPLASAGAFRLTGLQLKKYRPYSQDYARFEITDGRLDAGADYSYNSATNVLDLQVSNAFATLSHFHLQSPGAGEDLAVIPTLSIKQVQGSLARRTAEIGLAQSSGGSLVLRHNRNGSINLLAGLVPPNGSPATKAAPAPGGPWNAKIDEIDFADYALKAEDDSPAPPAVFNFDHIGCNLKNISTQPNAPVTATFSARLPNAGWVGVTGAATLSPLSADLQIGATNVDVRLFEPYLQEQVRMALTRGDINLNGRAHLAAPSTVAFEGNVAVTNFGVTDEVRYNDLATWDKLAVNDIDFALQPLKLHLGQIKFYGAKNSVSVGPDHRLNILDVLPERKPGPPETKSPSAPNAFPDLQFGEFAFANAAFHFTDRSIEPNCTFDVQSADGSVKNIVSAMQAPSAFSVSGRIDEFSIFSVTGKLNPMPDRLFVDVAVAFTNTGLTAFTPYLEKYAGRPLQKGKLSLALHYQIDHTALNASNFVFIDQLTLGPKNNSTNATHLPVKLAIALLKDRNGRIKLDVPVHGHLNDPKFKIAPIIWGVVENLLAKAATSPFALLGSMFGGGKELSFVTFVPGRAEIPGTQTNKLNTLARALFERPALTLEINGSVDPAADGEVIKRAKFERQLKQIYLRELTAGGQSGVGANELKLTAEEHTRLIVQLYSNKFGAYLTPAARQITYTPAPPSPPKTNAVAAVVKPVAAPQAGLFAHGATRMVFRTPRTALALAAVPAPAPIVSAPPAAPPAPTPTALTPTELAAMETRLLQKVDVTPDDFQKLMKERASQVERYLLGSRKVTADRLFITAPKPIDAHHPGQDRVNLTLD